MLHLVYVIAGIAILFFITEYLWRSKKYTHETVRKFLHISLGSFIAFWPFLISRYLIIALALGFILSIFLVRRFKYLSKKFTIFKSVKKLDRQSHGELYFSIGILVASLLTTNKYIFLVAILNLSISDGLAAIIGKKYGKSTKYTVFGAKKSLIGSLAFYVCALVILTAYYAFSNQSPSLSTILLFPPFLTFIESLSTSGIDNLLIPIVVIYWLSNF